ncbi:MAG: hypothetical protein LBB17_03100 [Puniceicoccales bacterium]|jgi:hypothetical protein|nr:hypothetical protein [Puniceicoccales bacterium]
MDSIQNDLKLRPVYQEQAQRQQPTCSFYGKLMAVVTTVGGAAAGGLMGGIPGVILGGTTGAAIGGTFLYNRQVETTPSPQTKETPLETQPPKSGAFTIRNKVDKRVYSGLPVSDQQKIETFFETVVSSQKQGTIALEDGRQCTLKFNSASTGEELAYTITKIEIKPATPLPPLAKAAKTLPLTRLSQQLPTVFSRTVINKAKELQKGGSVSVSKFRQLVDLLEKTAGVTVEIPYSGTSLGKMIYVDKNRKKQTISLWNPHGAKNMPRHSKGIQEVLDAILK